MASFAFDVYDICRCWIAGCTLQSLSTWIIWEHCDIVLIFQNLNLNYSQIWCHQDLHQYWALQTVVDLNQHPLNFTKSGTNNNNWFLKPLSDFLSYQHCLYFILSFCRYQLVFFSFAGSEILDKLNKVFTFHTKKFFTSNFYHQQWAGSLVDKQQTGWNISYNLAQV